MIQVYHIDIRILFTIVERTSVNFLSIYSYCNHLSYSFVGANRFLIGTSNIVQVSFGGLRFDPFFYHQRPIDVQCRPIAAIK